MQKLKELERIERKATEDFLKATTPEARRATYKALEDAREALNAYRYNTK